VTEEYFVDLAGRHPSVIKSATGRLSDQAFDCFAIALAKGQVRPSDNTTRHLRLRAFYSRLRKRHDLAASP
jgi:hypothetical protein